MNLDDYFEDIAPGDIRIRGTRIGIETVLYDFIHRDSPPDAIAKRYPSLSLEQVYATITYYLHNRERLDRYLEDWIEHGREKRAEQERNPTPAMLRLREKRAAREALRGAA